jgi:tRNA(fMet)-specific endonuclease VapC
MALYILDTDTLTLHQHGHALVCQRIQAHGAEVCLSAITVQEQFVGWQAYLARARTTKQVAAAYALLTGVLLPSWQAFAVLSFTEPAILRFDQLVALRLNVGRNDLRIAATALENGATVVTRNRRDFGRVPGLAIEDWSL